MLQYIFPHCYSADDELVQLGHASCDALGSTIDVLVWNIYKGRRVNWARDFTELSAGKDLVLLQEAVLNTPSDHLFDSSSKMEWVMARSFRHPTTGVEHGIKTGCIVAADDKHFCLSPHAEPLSQTQKLLLCTRYPLRQSTESLVVINMHAINFVGVRKYIDQMDQLDGALSQHVGPIILAGDFNTWSQSRLEHFLTVSEKAGLTEAVMNRTSRLAHMNRHLDHVFYRGLQLESVESLGEYRSSDHAPIVASFRTA